MAPVTTLFARRWLPLHREDGKLAVMRNDTGAQYPGVYLLAYCADRLAGRRVRTTDVFYVGMSKSGGGVRQRLRQFQ